MADAETRALERNAPAGSLEHYRLRLALVRAGREREAGFDVGDRVRTLAQPKGDGVVERFECAGALILVRLDHERVSYPDYDRIAAERGVDGLIEEVARERLRMTQNLTSAHAFGTLGYGTDAVQLLDPMPPGVRLTKNGAWTIVHRVVDGKLKETSCCCKAPGSTTEACRRAASHRTRCRCYCHSTKIAPATRSR